MVDLEALKERHQDARLTRKHVLYLLGLHGVGAAVLDAAVNFIFACLMYRTTSKEIRIWSLPKNTIAGDLGVTVVIQSMLTTLIVGAMVRRDIRAKRIEPFAFPWPATNMQDKRSSDNWFMKALGFLSPSETKYHRNVFCSMLHSLSMTLLRGFLISVPYFLILWPLTIALIAPPYGGINLHGTWIPEIIKAIFGGVLGLIQTPLIAALILGAPSSIKHRRPANLKWSMIVPPTTVDTSTPPPTVVSPPLPAFTASKSPTHPLHGVWQWEFLGKDKGHYVPTIPAAQRAKRKKLRKAQISGPAVIEMDSINGIRLEVNERRIGVSGRGVGDTKSGGLRRLEQVHHGRI
ncbi:hypothetical protein M422DRAFT_29433 [Sphaerobolus stellatus SS14]|uniref:Unplaced genomic scaffold SPHSTscaffold_34, whole genome shotgun sequence n=1 Tax=Sphaerobolus stellatus (strain SS14) TaxID=990650 RepID=A0A0C9W423_SPHS4|nr:hypothetical protein M422DRAFT_29433 [Sphaerobolus stellatus SS14]